ncbi:MAG: cytochrome-c oxidase, cbb3-type subunit III [Sphingomonadales bacterium]|jgi:cytochrome c oxidase cbb3-type subunit 3
MSDDMREVDDHSGTETTGHEWDGIKELDTPLPKWWLWTFYVSIAWALIYAVVMPAWPYFGPDGWDYTKGLLGYSQRDVVAADIADVEAGRADIRGRIAKADYATILGNAELLQFAVGSGGAAFGDNCAGCHGQGAQGFKGFPNLNDDDWLWGGAIEDIEYTIRHGVRWDADLDTRFSMMPRFLADGLLTRDEVGDVTQYVLSLSGTPRDAEAASRGRKIFQEQCAACHGEQGQGDVFQGAPNLSDAIWLYGGDEETIFETVSNARYGVMPAWGGRLNDETIKELAVYVYSLGGGELAGQP